MGVPLKVSMRINFEKVPLLLTGDLGLQSPLRR